MNINQDLTNWLLEPGRNLASGTPARKIELIFALGLQIVTYLAGRPPVNLLGLPEKRATVRTESATCSSFTLEVLDLHYRYVANFAVLLFFIFYTSEDGKHPDDLLFILEKLDRSFPRHHSNGIECQ